ncbi:hypothetical protein NE237_031748 [Protea cynaroides]|uniref:Senescence regulator n=1 Tax=Protea cynaroides TaxID=273540 RepID=A0A9Q0L2Q3_9MAGN|nr:hypothetical protein NE237_031748 [Protea cynaroides]
MAGGYDFFSAGNGGRSFRNEDFEEEDVWSVVMDITESSVSSKFRKPKDTSTTVSSTTLTVKRLPTAPKMIPRTNNSSSDQKLMKQSSAPVNIPDWSKIYGKNQKKGSESSGYGGATTVINNGGFDGIVGGDDDDDDDFIPPHEWIRKKPAMNQISSFSVCEGVGRTLKGRDLSKVRNAILTRTGFLE